MMRWWVARDGRRLDVTARRVGEHYEISVDGHVFDVRLVPVAQDFDALLCADGRTFAVASQLVGRNRWRLSLGDRDFQVALRDPLEREVERGSAAATGPQEIRAPIPGKVVSVAVAPGERIAAGQPLVVLEAMKMENQICAEAGGEVEAVVVTPGTAVEGGQVLVVLR